MVTGYTCLDRLLVQLAAVGLFDDATVHLYTNTDLLLLPGMALGDFEEADFSGYASIALDGGSQDLMLNAEGDLVAFFDHVVLIPTTGVITNTVFGWWIQGLVLDTPDCLICARAFDEPITVTSSLTPVVVEPRFPLGQPRGN